MTGLQDVTHAFVASATPIPLVPFVYDEIPLGSITPNGWLRAEMETEAAGLAGHLYDFYSFVHNSSWLGDKLEYSGLNEAFPYWLNGIIPLAYTLDDQRLKDQVHEATDFILNQMVTADGWIGPEKGGHRLLWARTLIFFGWTNLVDANKTYEEPIVTAMHNFNELMNSMLRNNGTGLIPQANDILDESIYFWFRSRVAEMIVSLQWLYDKYPRGKEEVLLENMMLLHHYGYKWEDWFVNGTYIFDDLYMRPASDDDDNFQFLHGVNVGEGLKAPAVIRRFTHNDSLVETTRNGVQWSLKYHGMSSGTILADERENGVNPYYGAETCTTVEVMFSQSYNYRALGESFYADGAELAAYNALPGAMTGDCVNTMGQAFGLEPDYPCCTVNHPQGLPKFVQAAYVKVGDEGVLHALLSPTSVKTTVAGGAVSIDCETNYPFEGVLKYEIHAEKPFHFFVRQPTWSNKATLAMGSGTSTSKVDDNGLLKLALPAGKSKITYTIDTKVRTEPRANDTVAVFRGQLLYAAEIGAEVTSTGPHNYRNFSLYPEDYIPAAIRDKVRDYTMLNTTAWNIAIDPSTLEYHPRENQHEPLPTPIFAPGAPPMYMTAKACLIDWPLFRNSVPSWPIPLKDRKCLGDPFQAKLVPYGSAKLRMSELPVIDLSGK